jgi:hypothetical protein
MRDILEKRYRKIKNKSYVIQLFSENCAVYEIMWENMVESDSAQKKIKYST